MTAVVFLHPRMSATQVQDFARQHDMIIRMDHREHCLVLTAQPRDPYAFACLECRWEGDEPAIFDFEEVALPSVADIPICPRCEAFLHRLPILKGVPSHG